MALWKNDYFLFILIINMIDTDFIIKKNAIIVLEAFLNRKLILLKLISNDDNNFK